MAQLETEATYLNALRAPDWGDSMTTLPVQHGNIVIKTYDNIGLHVNWLGSMAFTNNSNNLFFNHRKRLAQWKM